MNINLYDFDNTIYKGDSSTDFFFFSLMRYPKILKLIPKIILSACKYKLKIITKTQMKEVIFSFVNYIPDIESNIEAFWKEHEMYIKDFYLKKNHKNDIIISASPEFLLKPITDKLKVKDLIGSKVDKKTGKFDGRNCHSKEKVKRLNKKYKNYEVLEAYSDSKSDIPMLKLAKKQYMIKGNKIKQVNY